MFGRVISFFSENKSLPSPFSLSGGVETTVGSDKVLTFTTNGTLTVSGSGVIRVLVVGGGAGGGGAFRDTPSNVFYTGAGGNGGQVVYNAAFSVSSGSYNVVIGSAGVGGSQGVGTAPDNVPGYQSSILGIIAYGGNKANSYGADGGAYITGISSANGNDGSAGTTNDINGTSYVYGSGAGSGALGTSITTRVGGNGGTGAGTGGGADFGALNPPPTTGSNYGGGGGGGARVHNTRRGDGAAGFNGIVIVRYTPN
jgi:hypothetical protein